MSNLLFGLVSAVLKSSRGFLLIEVFISMMIITLMSLLMHQLMMLYSR